MAKAVLVHRVDTHYDDEPSRKYQFPKQYLKRLLPSEGDWVIYYEPRGGGGRLGYNAVAKIERIDRDPSREDMYAAWIEEGSYLQFQNFVPYRRADRFMESSLDAGDGKPNQGLIRSAVRPVSDTDFFRIIGQGLSDEQPLMPRVDDLSAPGFNEAQAEFVYDFDRPTMETLVTRQVRDRVFRKLVLDAYDSRCAMTGLKLINGGCRAEVEAAHIKPVEAKGSDDVRNGIALSGTVHWMFDRGLIGLQDDARIVISRHVNDPDQVRALIHKSGYAKFPADPTLCPHPAFLQWHRENRLKI